MKIELKKVRHFTTLSEETNCFQAEIWIDGKRAGRAENRGHGGNTDYDIDDKGVRKLFEDHARSLPPTEYKGITIPSSAEFLIDTMVDAYIAGMEKKRMDKRIAKIDAKEKARNAAQGIPFTVRLRWSTEYRWVGMRTREELPKLVEHMRKKVGSEPEETVIL